MFISGLPLRAIFSVIFAVLSLASTVAAQDKPTGAPSPSDATALPILNLNPLARPTHEKTIVKQDGLFDFTPPRMIKPMGMITPSDRGESSTAQGGAGSASGPLRITLEQALARAVTCHAIVATAAGVSAAHYHHKALQSDYFPKVGAYLVNLHYNKFMGDTIQLFARRPLIPTVSRTVPPDEAPSWYWLKSDYQAFSLAGWWNALVSVPLFILLFFGWLWRAFLWARFCG